MKSGKSTSSRQHCVSQWYTEADVHVPLNHAWRPIYRFTHEYKRESRYLTSVNLACLASAFLGVLIHMRQT